MACYVHQRKNETAQEYYCRGATFKFQTQETCSDRVQTMPPFLLVLNLTHTELIRERERESERERENVQKRQYTLNKQHK
jgi:hypothetical protein